MTALSPPTPTHYTIVEGGPWIDWNDDSQYNRANVQVHSIRFEDNMIFYIKSGDWRLYKDPEEEARKTFFTAFYNELDRRHCISSSGRLDCNFEALERTLRAVINIFELKLHIATKEPHQDEHLPQRTTHER